MTGLERLWPTRRGGAPVDLPASEHDPDDVRELTDEILARPEYQEAGESVVQRVLRSIGDFFDNLFGGGDPASVDAGSTGSSWMSALAWLLVVGLIGGVVGYVVWMFATGRLGGKGRRPKQKVDAAVVTEKDLDVSAGDWTTRAEEHEAAGRWREGILCRYRALVVTLGDRGVISTVVGRTAGEYVREVVEAVPAGAGAFRRATELFEDVWYGGAPASSEDRDRFVAAADEVREAAAGLLRRPVAAGMTGTEAGRDGTARS